MKIGDFEAPVAVREKEGERLRGLTARTPTEGGVGRHTSRRRESDRPEGEPILAQRGCCGALADRSSAFWPSEAAAGHPAARVASQRRLGRAVALRNAKSRQFVAYNNMKKEVFAENDRPFPQIADRQDEWLQVSSSCSPGRISTDAVAQHVLCAIKGQGRLAHAASNW